MISALLLLFQSADGADDPIADAIAAELHRAEAGLRLPGEPPPHTISAVYIDAVNLTQFATMGAVVIDLWDPSPLLFASLRTGTPTFDSSNFVAGWGAWPEGSAMDETAMGLEPHAVQQDLWWLLDSCYKRDVAHLARKTAAYAGVDRATLPPSFLDAPPTVMTLPPAPPPDREAARDLTRALSHHLGAFPEVEHSAVYLRGYGGRRLLVDTNGTRVSTPEAQVEIAAVAMIRRADGRLVTDHQRWLVRDLSALPPRAELLAALDALVARLRSAQSAPLAIQDYSGPVLFEGDAAVDLFARMLGPALRGTPPDARVRSGETALPPPPHALHQRLLPSGWRAWDDPRQRPDLPSSFQVDAEGVLSSRLDLIEDGVVVGLYDSRTPYKGQTESHGYARGSWSELPRGAPGQLVVEAPQGRAARRHAQESLKAAAQAGGPGLLVVRRFADPGLIPFDHNATADFDGLPPPSEVYFRHPDGREERVLGLTFAELGVGDLQSLVATGPSVTGTRTISVGGGSDLIGDGFGVPATFTVPSVIVRGLKLVPGEAGDPQPLALPSPPR